MIKKLFKKNLVFPIILAVLLVVNSIQFSVLASDTQTVTQITIFHTNDMHGHLLDAFNTAKPPTLTQIGSDYTAAIKKSVPNSLLIDAGDATQGVPFATLSKGADIINLMNAAGYDGMVLGNHEFDYGKAQALANAKLASFPVVSANTIENGSPFLAGINGNNGQDFVKTVNGVKVGFFGITTEETVYKTSPASLAGITFEDPIKASKSEVSKLKAEGASVIVGIMHMGNDPSSSPIGEDIAKAVDGINVIIDGHSHTVENKLVNNTLIAQTGCYNASLGRVDISIGADGKISSTENLIAAASVASSYTPDKSVVDIAAKISDSQKPIYAQIVGRTNTAFWSGTVNGQSISRLVETNLGDLVADAMVDGAKTQINGTEYAAIPIVALENGGGVRASIPAGDINQGQITTVLPFGNILSLKEVTPSLLYQVLENGVSKIAIKDTLTGVISGADGRFPQVSGMRFEYNPQNPVSSRISKLVLLNSDGSDKQALDKNDTSSKIVLVSNDFEVGGGDGYTMLGSLKNIGEGNALDVVTSGYIAKLTAQKGGAFSYPAYQGRVKISSSFTYNPYTAQIAVKNGQDPVAANLSITYAIDNGNAVQGIADDKGILTIPNVPSGPHTVSILCNNLAADCYINDVIGSNTTSSVIATLVETDGVISKGTSDMINALPSNVTLSHMILVADARASYDRLTLAQKALVTNYSKLTTAEAAIPKFTTGIPVDKKWKITMTQSIDYATLNSSNVIVTNNTIKKNVDINLLPVANDKKSFIIQPKNNYDANTSYTITIDNLRSSSSKSMKHQRNITFTTSAN